MEALVGPVSRRAFVAGAGALAGVPWLGACGRNAGGAVLRVAGIGKGEGDPALLLRTAGVEPRGFRLQFVNFPSGQLSLEAVNSGSLDLSGMSEIPPIFAASSAHRGFRQIAVYHGDVNNQVVLVPKGSAARSIGDLKGKRIGYVRATTTQYFLIRMLEQAGLGWNDIQPIAMGVSDGAAAFSQGALDAWAIYGFPIQRAIATEGARILRTAFGILSGNYLIAAHIDALADKAAAERIGAYLRLLKQGFTRIAAEPDRWAQAIAADIGVPLAYVRDQFRRRSDGYSLRSVTPAAIASQQAVADVFAKAGLIPARVDVRALWDDRFNALIEEA